MTLVNIFTKIIGENTLSGLKTKEGGIWIMAKICPECGREFSSMSQSVKCPICKCNLVDDEGVDNSEAARKQRLQKLQNQKLRQEMIQSRQERIPEVKPQIGSEQYKRLEKNRVSGLGIAALIFSLSGCLSFVGTILAIIDLCIKDGKKKVCSIIALVITCLWCLIIIIAFVSGDSKPKTAIRKVESQTTKQYIQDSNVQTGVSVKDTFGLMETAEMNDIQVTMMSYNENYGSEWNKPADGNVFLLVEFEIVNNSGSELGVSSMISFSGYADGYSASTSFSALMENEQNQLDGTIASGMKMRGWIGYEVPSEWRKMEIHFTDNVWSNNKFKFLIQK